MRIAALIALVASPALGADDRPLSAEAFAALTTGRTITYSSGGIYYGTEQYLPGRRVIWTFGDYCQEGRWDARDDMICFTYEDDEAPSCWIFRRRADGLAAWDDDDPEGEPLVSTYQSRAPMACGPEVGV
ncbi:hypothetical protein [Albidovulum sp.]|uniref:hypothetical protein n=1 Tax=Albidovulum sp. TaxID=1872424 RepID=UPI001D7A8A3C|nr:hypothetical protein [Paracoccaceae bacterium]HPE26034.1 hypothetical protein [Albidovulum sp.]MCB2131824.1 hypothetical protein [Paracoccaceae bacterium]MCB2140466.1 hypothetical protein [Paracoccaceae bacterium]MCB2143293.1 hypothetical protein [Paracoccaceae bacterium]